MEERSMVGSHEQNRTDSRDDTLLTCSNVGLQYGDIEVLAGVSLDVARGEIVALQGASGSGKSSLLHIVAGLLSPSGGEVRFAGNRYDDLSDARRSDLRLASFGVVFQSGDLIPELSMGENVEVPLRLQGVSRQVARRRAREQLDELGIGELYDRSRSQVSGGQAQRVAIARALVHEPDLILADEPTGALDEENASTAIRAMLSLVRGRRAAALVVTHDGAVAAMCDRVLHVRGGRLDGTDARADGA